MFIFADDTTINSYFQDFSLHKKIIFATLCCERQIPNYTAFFVQSGKGDPYLVRETIDKLWMGVINNSTLSDMHNTLNPNVEKLSWPEVDESSYSIFAYSANTLIESIAYINNFLVLENSELIIEIADLVFQNIYQYLSFVADPLRPEDHPLRDNTARKWAENSPLINQEKKQQLRDLESIKHIDITKETIVSLRNSSYQCGIQPFIRNLVISQEMSSEFTGHKCL